MLYCHHLSGPFIGLSRLERLDLTGNNFSTLPIGMFDGTGLGGWRLFATLDEESNFWKKKSSLELVVGLNLELPVGVFDGLTMLQELSLTSSSLKRPLPAGVFRDLARLEKLNLTNIVLGTFQQLTGLKELHLQNNNLETLPAGFFKGLKNLQILDLQSNGLKTLPAGVFSNLRYLQRLSLRNNGLEVLPSRA